ncbi:cyclin-B1-1-like isoform X1 [Triticum dicoccoides]|uniref:cyclin-B1-1-like isoform X1 n=1 Tax=Triticum dicoccoides TaxID=85692 RepID=UPI00188EF0E7|nr:cyclin-B1-1-like isoform X1 [Triticum dicoccoides]
MAARAQNNVAAAQQQNRALGGGGGGVPAMGKQQKAAMAGRPDPKNTRRALGDIGNFEANNRRAPLGDIANVVNARAAEGNRKPQPHEPVNRPVTRNFGAQLLKNAQEKAKNPAARPAVRRAHHVKPAPPPPEHVIEISSDSDVTKSEAGSVSSVRKYSRKKVVTTLSHVLSARSKFAAGITEEPAIQDIDKLDGDNQLAVVDYIEDIYKFYKVAENECLASDYMDSQVEINAKMRGILIDWILEVHQKFDLMPESLYLTVYIIDMYLSLQSVLRRELQLVGVSALLIACKYEEIWAPEVNDFILISDSAYTREQILKMEKAILNRLEWNLTVPTHYVFLVRFAKAACSSDHKNDKEMENTVFFFAELALLQYGLVQSKPSMVAAAAVYAARLTLKKTPLWTDTLKHHTGFTEAQLMDAAKILVASHSTAPDSKLKVVYKKYSSEKLGGVALRPPATDLCK